MQDDRVHEEDESLDIEDGPVEEEEFDSGTYKKKLSDLRKKLLACDAEKKEYLTGWQRAKADMVNYRQQVGKDQEVIKKVAAMKLISDLLQPLDSFFTATQGEAWQSVDPNWRSGVEQIYAQLLGVLKAHGLESFGEIGEAFSPHLHEAVGMEPTKQEEADHTILRVLQNGYRLNGEIVRPAKVIIAAYQ